MRLRKFDFFAGRDVSRNRIIRTMDPGVSLLPIHSKGKIFNSNGQLWDPSLQKKREEREINKPITELLSAEL